jgi:hypothetical protein
MFYYLGVSKGHRDQDLTETPTAIRAFADVGKWLNPSPLHGGALGLRGFKSHRRLQLKAPTEVAPSARAMIHTAEAARTRNPIIRLQAVELNRRFSTVTGHNCRIDCRKSGKRKNRQPSSLSLAQCFGVGFVELGS